jgi:uncharacterized protein YcbK (DUF882 family)
MNKTFSVKNDGNKKLSAHFSVSEFRCKDGTDTIILNLDLIAVLEKLFAELKCGKINVTSGYRTDKHSISVGGYTGDQHTKGNAADIICYDLSGSKVIPAKDVCCALERINHNGGVGYISANSVHVDVRGKKVWFDETKSERTTDSWYKYFGLKKPEIATATVKIAVPKSTKVVKIEVGSKVKVRKGARDYNNRSLAKWVFNAKFDVLVAGERTLIGIDGEVTAAVHQRDLIRV